MATIGRWSPTKVRNKIIDGTWVAETRYPMELVAPSSIAFSGTSASISGKGSVTFSAVSSLSLNGVFTSDFDNYAIIYNAVGSVANFPQLRLRANGVDESSASNFYTNQFFYSSSTTVSANRSSLSFWYAYGTSATLMSGSLNYLYGPALAQPTAYRSINADPRDGATVNDYAGTHSQSTSYDGFTLFPHTGSFTGRIAVYGLRG